MVGIPKDYEIKRGVVNKKNQLLEIFLQRTILDSKNETPWSGFLWYLAPPSGE